VDIFIAIFCLRTREDSSLDLSQNWLAGMWTG